MAVRSADSREIGEIMGLHYSAGLHVKEDIVVRAILKQVHMN